VNWGSGGGWNDATSGTFPDWLQVEFDGPKSIDEVDVFTNQDNYANPSEPTEGMTFTQYGLTGYVVQYWTGAAWATVQGGSVTGNNKVWRKFTFPAVVTTKIRVLAHACMDGYYSRLAEVEAWGGGAAGAGQGADLRWLVTDQLGTPRMVVDRTGSLAGVTRHDYLPFGEELYAGAGGRADTQGYDADDNVRQKFTGYERDDESKLDYAQARYYASVQGRFTSLDPLLASGRVSNPQSWNRYTYVLNNPLRFIDPNGLQEQDPKKKPNPESTDPDPNDDQDTVVTIISVVGAVVKKVAEAIEPTARAGDILEGASGGGFGGGAGGAALARPVAGAPAPPPPPATGRYITLGLNPHYSNLARQTGGLPWERWYSSGLTGRLNPLPPIGVSPSRFGRVFFHASRNADGIQFALDDLDRLYNLDAVFHYGSKGFIPRAGPWGDMNMTNAEFHSIYTNQGLFNKTQFYFRGDGLLYQPVPPPRPFGWRPFTF